jgi:AraC family transcriptional regulator
MAADSQSSDRRYLRQEYTNRINRAIDFIEKNIDGKLTLANISDAAGFSAFHFHRIFRAMTGETLNNYIKRLRIEKAAMMLVYNPKHTLTYIAISCGFSGSAAFSRGFREHYGLSPSEYRNGGYKEFSKNGKIESKNGKDKYSSPGYIDSRSSITGRRMRMDVEVKEIPEMHVAYVRNIGPYMGDTELFGELFGKLGRWAGPRNLINKDTLFLSVYYDDPKITDEEKLRVDVCLTVTEDTKVDGEISRQKLDGGLYALARFEIKDPADYGNAWEAVYRDWLPESGYQPDNKPTFEVYRNNPKEHPEGVSIVDICIPVKPL